MTPGLFEFHRFNLNLLGDAKNTDAVIELLHCVAFYAWRNATAASWAVASALSERTSEAMTFFLVLVCERLVDYLFILISRHFVIAYHTIWCDI